MSMHPEPIRPVLEETARVARAAFPKGIEMRDVLGTVYKDENFAKLFEVRERPAGPSLRSDLLIADLY